MVVETYYSFLSGMFSPVLNLNFVVAELILASIVVFFITTIYRFLIDQKKAKEIKGQISELQKKLKEVKDNKDEMNRVSAEMMKLTNQQMRSTMKPMLVVMVVAFLFLPWMASTFSEGIVSLPFSLPMFGNDFGWLAWYIVISIPLSMIFRKVLGVVS